MKKAAALSLFIALFSLNSLAQQQGGQQNFDKRNSHIFCWSHLTVVSESLAEDDEGRQALAYLSDMHRDAARSLGASQKHFSDVTAYLRDIQNNDRKKWEALSVQSKRVCLPKSGMQGGGQGGQ